MSSEVVNYITQYGYLAIFILVFLQELGVPSPIPSELILMFTGYLSYKGLISFPLVILTEISSVIIGTLIMYFLFYSSGVFLLKKKPKWFPVSDKLINRITEKINNGGLKSIYVFRMISITRGYSSVIVGLLRIKPGKFIPVVLISASLWVTIYAILGFLLGPYWDMVIRNIGHFKYFLIGLIILIICVIIVRSLVKQRKNRRRNESDCNSD